LINLQYSLIGLQYSLSNLQYSSINLQYSLIILQYSLINLKYCLISLQYSLINLQYIPSLNAVIPTCARTWHSAAAVSTILPRSNNTHTRTWLALPDMFSTSGHSQQSLAYC
jgi:hypothetical protein